MPRLVDVDAADVARRRSRCASRKRIIGYSAYMNQLAAAVVVAPVWNGRL